MLELSLEKTDVLILAGGLGKRLRQVVNDRPKPMADIGGRPFLDLLIDYAFTFGARRFILATGYKGESISSHYRSAGGSCQILFSKEEEPLGTGGAVRSAQALIQSNPFLVMNGDSFCAVDLGSLVEFHKKKNALLSIVLASSDSTEDYGSVTSDSSHRVTSFCEKVPGTGRSGINAGIYLMNSEIFSYMPRQKRFSLEYDLFPGIVNNRCYGFVTEMQLTDIGTPERYAIAKELFKT